MRPPTPEEATKIKYSEISEDANVSLYGDVLGYFDNSDEIERVSVFCKNDLCDVGYSVYIGPRSIGLARSELELLGKRRGVNMLVARTKSTYSNSISYGGWLEHSFFGSNHAEFINEIDPDHGGKRIVNYAIGNSTGENPNIDGGSAEWIGLMFGRDIRKSRNRGNVVRGEAKITVNFDEIATEADVEFTNIASLKSNHGRRAAR